MTQGRTRSNALLVRYWENSSTKYHRLTRRPSTRLRSAGSRQLPNDATASFTPIAKRLRLRHPGARAATTGPTPLAAFHLLSVRAVLTMRSIPPASRRAVRARLRTLSRSWPQLGALYRGSRRRTSETPPNPRSTSNRSSLSEQHRSRRCRGHGVRIRSCNKPAT